MNLQTITAALSAILLIAACNNGTESNIETVKKDSIATTITLPLPVKPEPVVLKDIILNEKTLMVKKLLTTSYKMNVNDYKTLSVRKVDSTGASENGFSYHIVDTLFSKTGLTVLLIGREYISENIVWLVVYRNDHKLTDQLQVYYDNAEGFLFVETIIKNNQVLINTKNDFEEGIKNTTEKYRLDDEGNIIKL